ncbi:MAG: DUF4377 domain-containing protein [Deltaproteobacteria bacterium]|nr:DUF4377 domain-containing protein [Deltaproteobacteria bacterium]
MHISLKVALQLLVFAMTACGPETEEITLVVEDYRVPCYYQLARLCYLTNEGVIYEDIENWRYRWGYQTVLQIKREKVKNPLMDELPYRYYYEKEIFAERVVTGSKFKINIQDPGHLTYVDESRYSLVGEQDIDCGKNSLCEQIAAALQNDEMYFKLELSHPANESEPFLLETFIPHSKEN